MTLLDREPAEPEGTAGSARPAALPLDRPEAAPSAPESRRAKPSALRRAAARTEDAALPFDLAPDPPPAPEPPAPERAAPELAAPPAEPPADAEPAAGKPAAKKRRAA